ncbi:MAG: bifunctional metallophosphatase/5'-nucleotidase [Bacteroidetes bacterium]|nr:bifunctional metallophosphatase/5'-nucleotidase [Bacteroidota bacterium]
MKTLSCSAVLVTVSLILLSGCEREPLTILHWNDAHSNNLPFKTKRSPSDPQLVEVGGYAWLKAALDSIRDARPVNLTVFAGDEFQGTPISSETAGRSQIPMLQALAPDFLVPGNHEFDYGDDHFLHLADSSGLNWLAANLIDSVSRQPVFQSGQLINRGGWKVAVVGITTPELKEVSLPVNVDRFSMIGHLEAIRQTIDSLNRIGKPDLYILISHAGLDMDSTIARAIPDFDLIIGGHTHSVMAEPSVIGKTRIVQSGSRGRFLGEITISEKQGLPDVAFKVHEIGPGNQKPDKKFQARIDSMEAGLQERLKVVIGEFTTELPLPTTGENALANWITDAYRWKTGAEISMMNAGGIRRGFHPGPVSRRDIWELAPFGNYLVDLFFTGQQLEAAIRHSLNHAETPLHFSGLQLTIRQKRTGSDLIRVSVNGQPVRKETVYRVTTNNFVALQARAMFGIDPASLRTKQTGLVDRDVLMERIQTSGSMGPVTDGRLKVIP